MSEHKYIGPAEDDYDSVLETLDEPHGVIAVDTETINVKNQTIIGIGIAYGPHRLYVRTFPDVSPLVPYVMWKISRPDITKVYHNLFFDIRALTQLAEEEGLNPPDETNLADTSIMAKVSGYGAALDETSIELLGYTNEFHIKELLLEAGRGATMLDVDFDKVAIKCLNDCYATINLYHTFKLTPAQEDCYEVDMRMAKLLLRMERRGLRLHQPLLLETRERLKRETVRLKDLCAQEGFNPGSPQQVGYVLASRGNILPFTKSRRSLRTDDETLSELDDDLAQTVLDYRKASKLLGTYVEPWVGADRAYTHFRMDLSTGRLASFDRNLQNIPPEMRGVFLPDNEVFSWFDYSQIELRVVANLSHDKALLDAFATGVSPHEVTRTNLWPASTRYNADGSDTEAYLKSKTFNFAMIYDAAVPTLAKRTKTTKEQAASLRWQWLNTYHGVADFMKKRQADDSPYAETLYGRRMRLPTIESLKRDTLQPKPDRAYQSHIDKTKINYVVQGTAADIMKRAALLVEEAGSVDSRLQVHDEWLVDGYFVFPRELEFICPEFHTPFAQYFGTSWK